MLRNSKCVANFTVKPIKNHVECFRPFSSKRIEKENCAGKQRLMTMSNANSSAKAPGKKSEEMRESQG